MVQVQVQGRVRAQVSVQVLLLLVVVKRVKVLGLVALAIVLLVPRKQKPGPGWSLCDQASMSLALLSGPMQVQARDAGVCRVAEAVRPSSSKTPATSRNGMLYSMLAKPNQLPNRQPNRRHQVLPHQHSVTRLVWPPIMVPKHSEHQHSRMWRWDMPATSWVSTFRLCGR